MLHYFFWVGTENSSRQCGKGAAPGNEVPDASRFRRSTKEVTSCRATDRKRNSKSFGRQQWVYAIPYLRLTVLALNGSQIHGNTIPKDHPRIAFWSRDHPRGSRSSTKHTSAQQKTYKSRYKQPHLRTLVRCMWLHFYVPWSAFPMHQPVFLPIRSENIKNGFLPYRPSAILFIGFPFTQATRPTFIMMMFSVAFTYNWTFDFTTFYVAWNESI